MSAAPETAGAPAADSAEPAAVDSPAATAGNPAAVPGTESGKPAPAQGEAAAATEVVMPQMGESITEGTITKWLKRVGDTVQRDEPLFEISTDKVDAEIPSPVAGKLTEIKVPEGSTVTINTVVALVGGESKAAPAAAAIPQAAPAAQQNGKPSAAPVESVGASQSDRLRSSPLVRKIAADKNVDLGAITGTGAAGRITKADLEGHLAQGASSANTSAPAAASHRSSRQATRRQSLRRRRSRRRRPQPPRRPCLAISCR